MDNQHRMIKGYRELSEEEIALMNVIKEHGAALERLHNLVAMAAQTEDSVRWVAIGRTQLQQGLMAFTRSIAQPTFF
jgi:hypothetical protein